MLKNLKDTMTAKTLEIIRALSEPADSSLVLGEKAEKMARGYNYGILFMPEYRKKGLDTVLFLLYEKGESSAKSILSEIECSEEPIPDEVKNAVTDSLGDISAKKAALAPFSMAELSPKEEWLIRALASYAGGFTDEKYTTRFQTERAWFDVSDKVAKSLAEVVNGKIELVSENQEARITSDDVKAFRGACLRGLEFFRPEDSDILVPFRFSVSNAQARGLFGSLVYPRLTKKTMEDGNVLKNIAEFKKCALKTAKGAIMDMFYIATSHSGKAESTIDDLRECLNQTAEGEKAEADRKAAEVKNNDQYELAGNIVA